MISGVISPGDKMELIRIQNSIGEEVDKKQFNSKVLDLLDEETAKISMPMEHNRIIPLEPGEKYQFCFYTERGLFQCQGEVVERYKDGALSVLVVKFDSDLERYQRRQYYRLECVMNIDYRVHPKSEDIYENRLNEDMFRTDNEKKLCEEALREIKEKWIRATIVDISGGGCRFNSQAQHEKGQRLKVRISYSYQGRQIDREYDGKVVHSEALEKKRGFFENRVEFQNIDIDDRETLIKFIFEEERKIRRRERGLN